MKRLAGSATIAGALVVVTLTVFVEAAPSRFPVDRAVDIEHIRLDLAVNLEGKEVTGVATITLTPLREVAEVALDAVDHRVARVFLAVGESSPGPVPYVNDGKHIKVVPEEPLRPRQKVTLRIEYSVKEAKGGLHFIGPSEAEPDLPRQLWSQGETVSNRYWFPSVDHPNEMQTTEMVVTVEQGYEAISNGRLVSWRTDAQAGTTTFHWLQDKPHVAYLVSLVVGKFAVVEERWRGRPVTYYVPVDRKGDVPRVFGKTLRMLDFFSETIGIEYPWDKYTQVVVTRFVVGGMENTSATTLHDRVLHDERAHLDYTPDYLVAHELAHQWWGDLLTCREWAHTWLNEGFATYFQALWQEYDQGRDEFLYDLFSRKMPEALDHGKDRPVVDRTWEYEYTMFDGRSYDKGAWVLHMLRCQLGDEAFFASLRNYIARNRGRCVETADPRSAFEETTGRSLERFFYEWTERPGHPVLEVGFTWQAEDKLGKVVVQQTQPGDAFHFPLTVEFWPEAPAKPVVIRHEVNEKREQFYAPLARPPRMVRVDPGNTILKEIKEDKGRDLWLTQLREDPDPIGRIQAARHLGESRSASDAQTLADALPAEEFWGVQAEIAKRLGEIGGDTACGALVAGLTLDNPKVRRTCVEALGKFHGDAKAMAALRERIRTGDASYFVEAEAARAYAGLSPADAREILEPLFARDSYDEVIRRAVLAGLAELNDETVIDLLAGWTKRGKPYGCRVEAIDALARAAANINTSGAMRQKAVDSLAACLRGEDERIRRHAVEGLRVIGEGAYTAVGALQALADQDHEPRVRELAGKAVERIRSGAPAQVELQQLRDELGELRKTNRELRERVDELEGKARAVGTAPASGPTSATSR